MVTQHLEEVVYVELVDNANPEVIVNVLPDSEPINVNIEEVVDEIGINVADGDAIGIAINLDGAEGHMSLSETEMQTIAEMVGEMAIPENVSAFVNDVPYATETYADVTADESTVEITLEELLRMF